MGYRSYGWLVLPTQIYNKVKESQGPEGILQIWQTEWDSTKQMETNSGEYTILNYNDWKMYESYPDVDAIEKFVTEAECDEYNITDDGGNKVSSSDLVRFVRVGEDNDDIVVRGNGFWDIHPVTSINW